MRGISCQLSQLRPTLLVVRPILGRPRMVAGWVCGCSRNGYWGMSSEAVDQTLRRRMAMESKPPWGLLPRPAAPYSLLRLPSSSPDRGLLRGSSQVCPFTPLLTAVRHHLALAAPVFMVSTSTARVLMWSFPGAAGGTHWPRNHGLWLGSPARRLR